MAQRVNSTLAVLPTFQLYGDVEDEGDLYDDIEPQYDENGNEIKRIQLHEERRQREVLACHDGGKSYLLTCRKTLQTEWNTIGDKAQGAYRDMTLDQLRALNCVHHFNFFGRPVTRMSATSPAASVAIIMSTPKHLNFITPNGLWKSTVMECATQLLDPVVIEGELDFLDTLSGTALQNACIGRVRRCYSHLGYWVKARRTGNYDEEEGETLCDDYMSIVQMGRGYDQTILNGYTEGFPSLTRESIIEANNDAQRREEAIRQAACKERIARGRVPSRLGASCIKQEDLDDVPIFVARPVTSDVPSTFTLSSSETSSSSSSSEAPSSPEASFSFAATAAPIPESPKRPLIVSMPRPFPATTTIATTSMTSSEDFNRQLQELDKRNGLQPLTNWADGDDDEFDDDDDDAAADNDDSSTMSSDSTPPTTPSVSPTVETFPDNDEEEEKEGEEMGKEDVVSDLVVDVEVAPPPTPQSITEPAVVDEEETVPSSPPTTTATTILEPAVEQTNSPTSNLSTISSMKPSSPSNLAQFFITEPVAPIPPSSYDQWPDFDGA